MTARPLAGAFHRFTGLDDGPAYVDLFDIAAVTEARHGGELIAGSRVVLYSGVCLFVKESAEAVFTDMHNARENPREIVAVDRNAILEPPAADKLRQPGAPDPTAHKAGITEEDSMPGDRWRVKHKFRAAAKDAEPIVDEFASSVDAWAYYEKVRKYKGLLFAQIVDPGGLSVAYDGQE